MAATLTVAANADAQQQPAGGPRNNFHGHSNSSLTSAMPPACRNGCFSWERGHGFRGLRQAQDERILVVEREVPVIVEREVVREVVTPPPTPVSGSDRLGDGPLPGTPQGEGSKRKPYAIGSSYASLPGGCMKMIDEGVSFYYCGGGEWYKQAGKLYRAVAKP